MLNTLYLKETPTRQGIKAALLGEFEMKKTTIQSLTFEQLALLLSRKLLKNDIFLFKKSFNLRDLLSTDVFKQK